MKKRMIGVTGGFGTGKSVTCRFMENLGAKWIEADSIVVELYKPGALGYRKIEGYFGRNFVDPKKGVRRNKLRREVLKNAQKLWILNKLIHPLITHEVSKKIVRLKKAVVCIESVYFEKADLGKFVDKIIEVKRDPELVAQARAREGKWKIEEIYRFMKLSPIFPKPDFVIENNGTFEELERKAKALYARISV